MGIPRGHMRPARCKPVVSPEQDRACLLQLPDRLNPNRSTSQSSRYSAGLTREGFQHILAHRNHIDMLEVDKTGTTFHHGGHALLQQPLIATGLVKRMV